MKNLKLHLENGLHEDESYAYTLRYVVSVTTKDAEFIDALTMLEKGLSFTFEKETLNVKRIVLFKGGGCRIILENNDF